jgi:hypothetical protein
MFEEELKHLEVKRDDPACRNKHKIWKAFVITLFNGAPVANGRVLCSRMSLWKRGCGRTIHCG